jgi:hypothetical protein
MKKTFPLTLAGRHPDRVLEALKHEIRQYLKRERRKPLPEGVDFQDFDCRFGLTEDSAETTTEQELIRQIDAAAAQGATHVYVEILAKPGHRKPRPVPDDAAAPADASDAAQPPVEPAAE